MGNFKEVEERLYEIYNTKKDKEIAEKLGVNQSTYGNWKNRNKIPYKEIISICVKDNLELEYILTGKKKENTNKKIDFKSEILQFVENFSEKELEYFYYLMKAENTRLNK